MAIWEIVGVAGSGKTTLRDSIMASSEAVQGLPSLKRPGLLHVWLYAIGKSIACYVSKRDRMVSLPEHVRIFRHSYRYRIAEFRIMVSLIVMTHALGIASKDGKKLIVLDQGPIYQIAVLNALGVATERPGVRAVCDACMENIKKTYSGIAYLTAMDDVLDQRRKSRDDWTKYLDVMGSEELIRAHHKEYQDIYERLIDELASSGGIFALVIKSDESSITESSREILNLMERPDPEATRSFAGKAPR